MTDNPSKTIIEIYKNTALALKDLKITQTESYDEIINRLLRRALKNETKQVAYIG